HWLLPDLGMPTLPPRIPGSEDILPASAKRVAPEDAMIIARDPAAIYTSSGANVLLAASVASEELPQQVMQEISNAGFVPYVQTVRSDNPYYQVYIRVARDAVTTDTAVAALRQMGFTPELLVQR